MVCLQKIRWHNAVGLSSTVVKDLVTKIADSKVVDALMAQLQSRFNGYCFSTNQPTLYCTNTVFECLQVSNISNSKHVKSLQFYQSKKAMPFRVAHSEANEAVLNFLASTATGRVVISEVIAGPIQLVGIDKFRLKWSDFQKVCGNSYYELL